MSTQQKEYICIACPIGCHLNLEILENNELKVTGNKCKRGIVYAKEEYFAPRRIITATCSIESDTIARLPVKTDKAILKKYIDELLDSIYSIKVKAPVQMGDIIINNFKNTGVNVVSTRSI